MGNQMFDFLFRSRSAKPISKPSAEKAQKQLIKYKRERHREILSDKIRTINDGLKRGQRRFQLISVEMVSDVILAFSKAGWKVTKSDPHFIDFE